MKILFHHRIASRDGQAVHLEELCDALVSEGHSVVLVGPGDTANVEFGGVAGRVAYLKRTLPGAIYELLEFAYGWWAFIRLWRAWRVHRPDAVYERYNLYMLAGVWLRRLTGVPVLLEVNAPIREERSINNGLALGSLAAWAERTAWRGADYVLPVTQVLAEYVYRAGVPRERVVVVPNGVDQSRFAELPTMEEAKRRLGLEGKLVLGFTGFVRSWNSIGRAVEAVARIAPRHDIHFLMVGDGPARPALEALAASRGIAGRLTITGTVDREAIPGYLAAFDIAVQPGVTPYASPLKLFEYMGAGCAIVAPDMSNIREVLSDGDQALLFDSADDESFIAAVERLCDDAALRHRLGAAARASIHERGFTWSHNARQVAELIAACLRNRAGVSSAAAVANPDRVR